MGCRRTSHSSASRTARPTATTTSPTTRATRRRRCATRRRGSSAQSNATTSTLAARCMPGQPIRAVDCGDIRTELGDPAAHSRYTEGAVRRHPEGRRHADRAGWRSRRADPGAARVRRRRTDHADPDRPAHRLARRGERRARRVVEHDPSCIGNGAYRRDLPNRPARHRQCAHRGGRGGTCLWRASDHRMGTARGRHGRRAGAHPRRRALLHHGRSRWNGSDGCARGGGAFAGRRDVRSGTQADPRAGAQRTRRRNGCGGDHAATRRESDHLHHGRPTDREPDRHGGAGGILRQGGTSPAEDPPSRPASVRSQTRARLHRSGDDG